MWRSQATLLTESRLVLALVVLNLLLNFDLSFGFAFSRAPLLALVPLCCQFDQFGAIPFDVICHELMQFGQCQVICIVWNGVYKVQMPVD